MTTKGEDMPAALSFRTATIADAPTITTLVNSAYRGDASRAGWTTEADLLDGVRTTEDEVGALIAHEGSVLLLCVSEGDIIGSVHLQKEDDGAYLGMFVVRPVLQGRGIGKAFIRAAEELVVREWNAARITMTVLSVRHELIAFYERRGYARTGRSVAWPDDALSTPKVDALHFEVLEKKLA